MIKVTKKGKKKALSLTGELTIYNALEFKQQLTTHMQDITELELDLSDVSELDTSGFQILLMVKNYLQDKKIDMKMINHSKSVIEVLDLYNMLSVFGDPVVLSEH